MSRRNKAIFANVLIIVVTVIILYFYLTQPVKLIYFDDDPTLNCQDCIPTMLIGVFVGILICVIRGSDDSFPKPKTGAKKGEVGVERSILPGVFMFLYLAVSFFATPQFRYLFQIGCFSSFLVFFTFYLLLNLHYRREEEENSIPNDFDRTATWLDELATKDDEEVDHEHGFSVVGD